MMPQGQLGQSQQPAWVIEAAAPVQVRANTGLLGNDAVQSPLALAGSDELFAEYRRLLAAAEPAFKLLRLKRLKFIAQGREARIAVSLAALNMPQPTDLTLAQWKEIVEEVEEEE